MLVILEITTVVVVVETDGGAGGGGFKEVVSRGEVGIGKRVGKRKIKNL